MLIAYNIGLIRDSTPELRGYHVEASSERLDGFLRAWILPAHAFFDYRQKRVVASLLWCDAQTHRLVRRWSRAFHAVCGRCPAILASFNYQGCQRITVAISRLLSLHVGWHMGWKLTVDPLHEARMVLTADLRRAAEWEEQSGRVMTADLRRAAEWVEQSGRVSSKAFDGHARRVCRPNSCAHVVRV